MEIEAHEAETNLSRLLERVERGEKISLTRHGRPVALLVPVEEGRTQEEAVQAFREFRRGRKLDGVRLRAMVEEGRF